MNPDILKIDGWMTPEELTWLYNTAKSVPEKGVIIEIGAWKGRSSAALYQGAYDGAGYDISVISIDTWKGQDDLPDHAEAKEKNIFSMYLENMKRIDFYPVPFSKFAAGLQFLVSDSVEAAALFDDESVDFIFIDGDHRKCGEDIDAWAPKMKPLSLITGHDYFCFYETIQQEIHKRFYIHELHDSIWARYVGLTKPTWYNGGK